MATTALTPLTVPALAGNTAAQIAEFQANFTSNIVTTGNSLLQAYIAQKDTDFYSVGDFAGLSLPSLSYGVGDVGSPPTAPSINWNELATKVAALDRLDVPERPDLQTPDSDVPTLDVSAPTLSLPTRPTALDASPPSNRPNIDEPLMPDAPSIVLPAVPAFDEFNLPTPPAFTIPSFEAVAPQNLLAPPTNEFSYVDPGYISALQDPLVQKLLDDLENGTYGIEPNDENMLWFRARDRAAQQARLGVAEAQRRAAATSFPMPQGAYFDALLQEEQKADQVMSEANRDIALRRSELYVEGRKFTIQQVREYEGIRMNLYNATQERALNYAKSVVEMGIAIYDVGVRNFSAQLDAYRTEASVFESKIRAELSKAEVYRVQVQAEQARVDFNRAKIAQYQAQLDGIKTTVELYRSRLTAVAAFMAAQKLKLETFQTEVQVYAEMVRAKETEYAMFSAGVRGEEAKVAIYRAQVDAYNATLAGSKTRAEIQLQSNEALIQSYRNASTQYASQLENYARQIAAMTEGNREQLVEYGAEVDAYRAFTSAVVGIGEVGQRHNRNTLDWNKAVLDSKNEQVRFRFKQLEENTNLQAKVNQFGIEFLRTALGATASGLNSLGVQTT